MRACWRRPPAPCWSEGGPLLRPDGVVALVDQGSGIGGDPGRCPPPWPPCSEAPEAPPVEDYFRLDLPAALADARLPPRSARGLRTQANLVMVGQPVDGPPATRPRSACACFRRPAGTCRLERTLQFALTPGSPPHASDLLVASWSSGHGLAKDDGALPASLRVRDQPGFASLDQRACKAGDEWALPAPDQRRLRPNGTAGSDSTNDAFDPLAALPPCQRGTWKLEAGALDPSSPARTIAEQRAAARSPFHRPVRATRAGEPSDAPRNWSTTPHDEAADIEKQPRRCVLGTQRPQSSPGGTPGGAALPG